MPYRSPTHSNHTSGACNGPSGLGVMDRVRRAGAPGPMPLQCGALTRMLMRRYSVSYDSKHGQSIASMVLNNTQHVGRRAHTDGRERFDEDVASASPAARRFVQQFKQQVKCDRPIGSAKAMTSCGHGQRRPRRQQDQWTTGYSGGLRAPVDWQGFCVSHL